VQHAKQFITWHQYWYTKQNICWNDNIYSSHQFSHLLLWSIIVTQLWLVQLQQKYYFMHKRVKAHNISGIVNQKCSIANTSMVNHLHVWWNLDATFIFCQSTLSSLMAFWPWLLSLQELVISFQVIFAVNWHSICDLREAMIDKTLIVCNLCHHNNSLPSILL